LLQLHRNSKQQEVLLNNLLLPLPLLLD